MVSFSTPSYLTRHRIEQTLAAWARGVPSDATVYDVGCGQKPYAHYFEKQHYVGIDTDPASAADVKYTGETIPLLDASADAIVCTETLQHVSDPTQTMNELFRLLKPGGTAFISVPYGIKMLAEPLPAIQAPLQNFPTKEIPTWRNDYWRFTKYGLLLLCQKFQVRSCEATTGYIATLLQLTNYAVASLNIGSVARPYFALTNGLGLLIDTLIYWVVGDSTFYDKIYLSFTSNYIAVLKKP